MDYKATLMALVLVSSALAGCTGDPDGGGNDEIDAETLQNLQDFINGTLGPEWINDRGDSGYVWTLSLSDDQWLEVKSAIGVMYYAGGDDDDYLYRWSQPVYVMSDNAYYFRSGMAPTFGGNYSICVDISGMNCYPYDLGSDYELYEWSIIYRIHNTAGVNYYYTGVLPPDPPDPPILENQTITLEVSYVPWNSTGDGNSSNSGNRIYGTIVIELYPNEAPLHVDSFLTHIQNGAYNNTTFHRVIDGFVIQGGDINNAGGYAAIWYGYCNGQVATPCDTADWTIPSESDNGLTHGPGTLAMARSSNPDSGGSQFYIVPSHSTPSHLDGEYTVFGQVISGQEHVDAISEVEIGPGDEPVYEVRLVHASINE